MKKIRHFLGVSSDLVTAGVVNTAIVSIFGVPTPGIQVLLGMGLPAFACAYNFAARVFDDRLAQKDNEKLRAFLQELKLAMDRVQVVDLERFIGLDFSTEEYAVMEELIREGISAKSKWVRKCVAYSLVKIGSGQADERSLYRYLRTLQELDDLDLKLLLLVAFQREGKREEFESVSAEIMGDPTIYALSIRVSGDKLARLGLTEKRPQLNPRDDEKQNKDQMIGDFLRLSPEEDTPLCREFMEMIQLFG